MTDQQAMSAVREGDLDKAALLYERYKRPLYNYFLRCGTDREAAQDIVQQVFVRVLQYRHTYQPEHEFRVWIYRIARNCQNDHYRTAARTVNNLDLVQHLAEEVSPNDDERVRLALRQLPTEYREVLILSRYEDLKYEQIAELLDCTVAAVKVRVHRAIKQLRDIYFQLA
jgi:RNA polymerase sigma factor (sigma-70 family)